MNDLSFWLYLSDVIPSLSDICNFVAYAIIFFSIAVVMVKVLISESYEHCVSNGVKASILNVLWAIPFFVLAAIIPGKETMYMIIASEIGQDVVTSQPASELYQKIDTIINLKIDQLSNNK